MFTAGFQGYSAQLNLSINGETVGSDFMCGLGGFGKRCEAAGKETTIYWVSTVYRAVNLRDPAEIGFESPFYTRINWPGWGDGIPVSLFGGTSSSEVEFELTHTHCNWVSGFQIGPGGVN